MSNCTHELEHAPCDPKASQASLNSFKRAVCDKLTELGDHPEEVYLTNQALVENIAPPLDTSKSSMAYNPGSNRIWMWDITSQRWREYNGSLTGVPDEVQITDQLTAAAVTAPVDPAEATIAYNPDTGQVFLWHPGADPDPAWVEKAPVVVPVEVFDSDGTLTTTPAAEPPDGQAAITYNPAANVIHVWNTSTNAWVLLDTDTGGVDEVVLTDSISLEFPPDNPAIRTTPTIAYNPHTGQAFVWHPEDDTGDGDDIDEWKDLVPTSRVIRVRTVGHSYTFMGVAGDIEFTETGVGQYLLNVKNGAVLLNLQFHGTLANINTDEELVRISVLDPTICDIEDEFLPTSSRLPTVRVFNKNGVDVPDITGEPLLYWEQSDTGHNVRFHTFNAGQSIDVMNMQSLQTWVISLQY